MRTEHDLAAEFERLRPSLRLLAERMLGNGADAEDAVQEAWLRLRRTRGDTVEDLRAWLTTVTSRVCLDALRRRRVRREVPVEIALAQSRDPVRDHGAGRSPSPEDELLFTESVGLALHVVMDNLTPAERVAFVLHDIFDVPFAQVSDVLGRSPAATKMLASRARRRVRLTTPDADPGDSGDRAVVTAFFAAAESGDVSGLLELLAPDVQLRALTPERTRVIDGAAQVAGQAGAGARTGARVRPITAGHRPAALIVRDGRPTTLITFTVVDGRITEIRSLTDPTWLAQLIPSWAI